MLLCVAGLFLKSSQPRTLMLSDHCAGLLLYAADLVLRAGQLANVTAVAAAKVDERSDIVTLQLKADAVSEGPGPSSAGSNTYLKCRRIRRCGSPLQASPTRPLAQPNPYTHPLQTAHVGTQLPFPRLSAPSMLQRCPALRSSGP